jgi:hypothetical protein
VLIQTGLRHNCPWLAGVIAGCASGCAEKLLPAGVRSSLVSATEALARARPRQEQR